MSIKIKIECINGGQMPVKATEGSAGYDVHSAVDTIIPAGDFALILTGIRLAIPAGYEAQIRPRSGLALNHGVTVLNAPGTIDSDYRGEIGVILVNLDKEPFTVKRGDRIAQLVFSKVEDAQFSHFSSLDETERGIGGFGSTGR